MLFFSEVEPLLFKKLDLQEADGRSPTVLTKSEVMSSDAGLRIDGVPALDL